MIPKRGKHKAAGFGARVRFFIAMAIATAFLWACAPTAPPPVPPGYPKPYRVGRDWYQPLPHAKDFIQRGIASWYGKPFHGRKTASGETFNMYAVSAAHKTLPLGTLVRVQNLTNNKKVKVRINDRGPFVRGRIIDLSYAAAKKIGLVGPGTAKVEIKALGIAAHPEAQGAQSQPQIQVDYFSGNFTVQVGAFKNRQNAINLTKKLKQTYKNAHYISFDSGRGIYYRVRVGLCHTLTQALEYEKILTEKGFKEAFVVAE